MPEVIELVAQLRVRYRLKIAVVRNEAQEMIIGFASSPAGRVGGISSFSSCSVHVPQPDADLFRLALFVANAIDLTSISTLGSAGFLLIFAAVNTANAFQAPQTNSRGWISAAVAVACLAALGALVWQTARTAPAKLWVLAALVALAALIEGGYRLTKREIRIMDNQPTQRLQGTPRILTINGGSSSIKFALFEAGDSLRRILEGGIGRIGLPEATLRVKGLNRADNFSRLVTAPDHTAAVNLLMDWLEESMGRGSLGAVGHRVVHGGPKYSQPQRITAAMVEELHHLSPFDPEHCRRRSS